MLLDVCAPRYVVIHSCQLWCVNLVLCAGVFVFGVTRFMFGNSHVQFANIGENIFISLWVDVPENDELSNIQDVVLNEGYCTHAADFDYSDGHLRRYTNISCIGMCPAGFASFSCLNRADLYTRKAPRAALLHTQFQDSITTTNFSQDATYLIPVVDSINVSFTYNYDVLIRGFGTTARTVRGHSSRDVLTVVLKKLPSGQFEPSKTLMPSTDVSFTVAEMLDLAGIPGFLDTINDETRENTIPVEECPGCFRNGAVGRVTGLDLVMTVECFNYDHFYIFETHDFDDEHICFVYFAHQPYSYAVTEDLQNLPGEMVRFRRFSGLGVTTQTKGRYWRFDPAATFKMLLHLRVFMMYPEFILAALVCYGLGELSVVYKKAIHQKFSTKTAFAGLVCRLMCTTVAFSELSYADGDRHKIGMPVFRDRLQRLVKSHKYKLSSIEIHRMVDLCFTAIVNYTQGCDFFGRITAERMLFPAVNAGIDADAAGTCWSTCASESASLLELIRFFDSERYVGFFEYIFLDSGFRSFIGWQKTLVRRGRLKTEDPTDNEMHLTPEDIIEKSVPVFREMEEKWTCEQTHNAVCRTLDLIEDLQSKEVERSLLSKQARWFSGCVDRLNDVPAVFAQCACAAVQEEVTLLNEMVAEMNKDVVHLEGKVAQLFQTPPALGDAEKDKVDKKDV